MRFTDQPDEVDIPNLVFPDRKNLRMILSDPAAGAYYVQQCLRPFIEKHSLQQVISFVANPSPQVRSATEDF